MTVAQPLSFCILNGYPRRNRQVLAEAGVSQADELYLRFLQEYVPAGSFEVIYVADLDSNLPSGADLTFYNGYLWTGSNLTIYHLKPQVTRQIELCRAIFEAGVPQYGSCWGVQMAAVAAGGEVRRNPNGREWCLARDITLTEDGRSHPLYDGKPFRFDGFIMHLDEVTRLPDGGTLLATNGHTNVQALEVRHGNGTFWATQYHPEYELHEMAPLLIARRVALAKEGFFGSEAEVESYAGRLMELSRSPEDEHLRRELEIGSDILDPQIRETELRNWIDRLVLPSSQHTPRAIARP